MATPYLVYGIVYDTDGTTALASVTVRLRNENTNESTTDTTTASGNYAIDLANMSEGYTTSDQITVYVIYTNYEDTETFTVTGGGKEQDLTLVAVPTSETIYMCTIQHVYDNLDGKTASDISTNRVLDEVLRSESEIERHCNTKFQSTAITDEIYSWNHRNSFKSSNQTYWYKKSNYGIKRDYKNVVFNDTFKLKNKPILTMTSLYTNGAGATAADDWTSLTEQTGSGGDYIVNKPSGYVTFLQNNPDFGVRAIKTSYTYGYSTVPKDVERLCILLSVKYIILTKLSSSQFDSTDDITIEGIRIEKSVTQTRAYLNKIQDEIDRLWDAIGRFRVDIS